MTGNDFTALTQAQIKRADDVLINKDERLSPADTLGEKLFRETQVFLGGAVRGFGTSAIERISETPLQTAAQSAASAAFSYAFVRLASSNFTPVRYALPVLAATASYSFLGHLSKDFVAQAGTLKEAWQETWKNNSDIYRQQERVAKSLGPFLFDFGLSSISGLAGGRLAASGIENRAILNYMDKNYGQQIKESVFKIASEPDKTGLRIMGSAFATDKNTLTTAFHVVQDNPGQKWTFANGQIKGEAKIAAGLPQYDLAILQTADGLVFKQPLQLARKLESLPSSGVIVGAVSGQKIEVRPALFQEAIGPTSTSYKADLGAEISGGFSRTVNGGRSWPGMSGGPAIAANGEVVGVMSTLSPFLNVFGRGTNSVPAPNMHHFLKLMERAKQPGASLRLSEAAREFSMPEASILKDVSRGKLQAFVVPSTKDLSSWEWRIMRPERTQ